MTEKARAKKRNRERELCCQTGTSEMMKNDDDAKIKRVRSISIVRMGGSWRWHFFADNLTFSTFCEWQKREEDWNWKLSMSIKNQLKVERQINLCTIGDVVVIWWTCTHTDRHNCATSCHFFSDYCVLIHASNPKCFEKWHKQQNNRIENLIRKSYDWIKWR